MRVTKERWDELIGRNKPTPDLPGMTQAGRDEQRGGADPRAAASPAGDNAGGALSLPRPNVGPATTRPGQAVGTPAPHGNAQVAGVPQSSSRWSAVRQANFEAIRDLVRTSVQASELNGIRRLLDDLEGDTFLDGLDRAALRVEIDRRFGELNRVDEAGYKPRWQLESGTWKLPPQFGGQP